MNVLGLPNHAFQTVGQYVPGRLLVVAFYAFAFLGGGAAFTSLLSESTIYGLCYGVWLGGVGVVSLAIAVGPIVGARVGGLDWDLETAKEIHLAGQGVLGFQLKALGSVLGVFLTLTLVGLAAGAIVATVGAMGEGLWRGDARFVSVGMATRLALAILLGLPFSSIAGWSAAVLLRSTYKAALLADGTLLFYIFTVRWASRAPILVALYRYSPWGSLTAMLLGGYYPGLVVAPVPSLPLSTALTAAWMAILLLAVCVSSRRRDVGGGRGS